MATTRAREIIDEIIARKNITQAEVARQVGISPSYLAQLASGNKTLTSSKEHQIKSAFPELYRDEVKDLGIPFFNVDFCLGYDVVFNDAVQAPSAYIRHPLNGHADCWVMTRGNSMSPLISNGDMLAIREVPVDAVLYGDVYAIVTDENRTIKRVRKGSEPTKWKLVPENKIDFDEQEIDISSVIKVYHVEAVAKAL